MSRRLNQILAPSGRVYESHTPEFKKILEGTVDDVFGFPTPEILPGTRALIWIDIEMVGTSCGYGVPLMKFEGHRKVDGCELTNGAYDRFRGYYQQV